MYDMLDKIQGADKVELQYKDEKDKNRINEFIYKNILL